MLHAPELAAEETMLAGEYCHDYSANKGRCGTHYHCEQWMGYIFEELKGLTTAARESLWKIVQCDSGSCTVGKYLDSCGGAVKELARRVQCVQPTTFVKIASDCPGKCEVCKGNCGPGWPL